MGWFWGKSDDDPVKKLDPGLREYLEHEAPKKYVPPTPEAPKPVDTQSRPSQAPPTSESTEPSQPAIPSASLYPDGRYAHLWKTYKPPASEETQKGAERVIEKYKQRGDTVHRAAMENCALEHEDLTYCFQTGTWSKRLKSRMSMCHEENHTFSRCFTTQAVRPSLGYRLLHVN